MDSAADVKGNGVEEIGSDCKICVVDGALDRIIEDGEANDSVRGSCGVDRVSEEILNGAVNEEETGSVCASCVDGVRESVDDRGDVSVSAPADCV